MEQLQFSLIQICLNRITLWHTEVDEWEIAPYFSDLLANTGVRFLKDRVKVLHPSDHAGVNGSNASTRGGTVHLESGLHIEYDWYNMNYLSTSGYPGINYVLYAASNDMFFSGSVFCILT
jgi:hypothetical protein